MEEKIQPHGLENPGEDVLSGLCMTCCHIIRLVEVQKDPLRFGQVRERHACPEENIKSTAISMEASMGAIMHYYAMNLSKVPSELLQCEKK